MQSTINIIESIKEDFLKLKEELYDLRQHREPEELLEGQRRLGQVIDTKNEEILQLEKERDQLKDETAAFESQVDQSFSLVQELREKNKLLTRTLASIKEVDKSGVPNSLKEKIIEHASTGARIISLEGDLKVLKEEFENENKSLVDQVDVLKDENKL